MHFREIFGDNQTEFSQRIGIEYKRWSNLERGYPMSRDLAWLLHKRLPGVSTDWFWFGKMDGLSAYYKEQIPLAEKRMMLRERAAADEKRAEQNRANFASVSTSSA